MFWCVCVCVCVQYRQLPMSYGLIAVHSERDVSQRGFLLKWEEEREGSDRPAERWVGWGGEGGVGAVGLVVYMGRVQAGSTYTA